MMKSETKKKLRIVFSIFLFLCFSLAAVFLVTYIQVSREAAERIDRGIIDSIIFSESPVYYDDGKSVMGVFFEKTHRKYIHYADIPPYFIKALIATEDRNFFDHPGFDPKALLRALLVNIRRGKIVQGGSTITQQTAKNIFKRERRSIKSKIRELIQALLLERKYSKEEILEMYSNQFFVTGFGRGLRIAAQYFFDKEVGDLSLVESAFIAGSVKSPNRYNPFTKKSEAEKREARRLSKLRKDFVLSNMFKLHFITEEQYLTAKALEVPFKEGRVTYVLNVILDYIREQLESEYFKTVLEQEGVDNIATSGIKIYTSINKEIQEGALRSLRDHLPLLDVKLQGYQSIRSPQKEGDLPAQLPNREEGSLPFLCRITDIQTRLKNPHLIVAWNNGGGIIDYEGLQPMGEAWLKGRIGNWAVFDRAHIPDFLKLFRVGDLVPVRFKRDPEKEEKASLVLTKIPELEGGLIVVREGMIKAMVGGFFDRFFNRAVDAKRQLGSIFKPIVFTAALQLNWNNLDPLLNMPDLFRFENTRYVPKPDHQPESDKVSLSWAGVKSENLATVWLLYHLTDRLNMNEFRRVMEMLDLERRKEESYGDYVTRIRDGHGVIVDREALMEAAFEEAKSEIESDLIFSGYEKALGNLARLQYDPDVEGLSPEERGALDIERRSFSMLLSQNEEMKRRLKVIRELLGRVTEKRDQTLEENLFRELSGFYTAPDKTGAPTIYYSENPDQLPLPDLRPISLDLLSGTLDDSAAEEIWIDAFLPSKAIDLLQTQMRKSYLRLLNYKRYDTEVLWRVSDFKRLVNLFYVSRLAKTMGVSTKLDPVLSFPLGANSISILEAALAYQTIMTGKVYPHPDRFEIGMVPVITKITDRQGKPIWEYQPNPKKILSPRTSALVCDILRLVVENGTGKGAKEAIRLVMGVEERKTVDLPIPSFGKTGTADQFTNSSFVGFIPGPDGGGAQLMLEKGYVIAGYVGYDDNRPMKGKQIVIYGASGALPVWVDVGNTIVNSAQYTENLQVADLAFNLQSTQMAAGDGLQPVPVSIVTGLPVGGAGGEENPSLAQAQILADAVSKNDILSLGRAFELFAGDEHEQK